MNNYFYLNSCTSYGEIVKNWFILGIVVWACLLALTCTAFATNWDALPTYTYTGSTWSGLHSFIDTYGTGTYLVGSMSTTSSTFYVDQNYVRIKGTVGFPADGDYMIGAGIYTVPSRIVDYSGAGKFTTSKTSGNAIDISGTGVVLENMEILNSRGSSSTANCLYVHSAQPELHNVRIRNGAGNAILAENTHDLITDRVYVSNLWSDLGVTGIGTGVKLVNSNTDPRFNDITVCYGYCGYNLTGSSGLISNTMQCYDANYPTIIDPASNGACDDMTFRIAVFDVGYRGSNAEGLWMGWQNSNTIDNIQIYNIWAYGHASGVSIGHGTNIGIYGGGISSDNYAMYLYQGVNPITIQGINIISSGHNYYALTLNNPGSATLLGNEFDSSLAAYLTGTYYFGGNLGTGSIQGTVSWSHFN
jgi:hypothetical protein